MTTYATIIPVLRVSDLARSAAWYQDILGFASEPQGDESMLLRRDDTALMLRRGERPPSRMPLHGDWDVCIMLAGGSLPALLDQARRRTPLVRGPEVMPAGAVEFELQDPDGHRVCIAEELQDTRAFPRAVS